MLRISLTLQMLEKSPPQMPVQMEQMHHLPQLLLQVTRRKW